ncbi:MAG: transglutaminase family protein [Gemmataceae bacterium]|jgi:transglutaminase-like putative cysteine protease|nr:transglutaminase family protein [Gemmataceae bacterium]
MILEVQHETIIDYSHPVREWLTELRMEPLSDAFQRCHSFQIDVSEPATLFRYVDGFGNRVHHFNLLAPKQQIRILAASVVVTERSDNDPMRSQATFPLHSDLLDTETLDYLPFHGPVRETPLLAPHLEALKPNPGWRIGMWVCQVAEYIRGKFQYARHVTDASSPIDDVLSRGRGVCQDFTHLMIAIVRSFGLPARYVSGYIHRPNKDSQSHAWCEVWFPDIGWSGFDPTNGCPIHDNFVKVAIGRDFTDVPPNKGIYRGEGTETIRVKVATRTLDRLPSLMWHDQLSPLDVPTLVVHRNSIAADDYNTEEQLLQQQQQQQQQ